MPRFFDVESSEEEDSDQEIEESTSAKAPAKFQRGARAAVREESSDDDDDKSEKRVVKSQKEKKAEELHNTFKSIRNRIKANDWNTGVAEFDALMTKQLPKTLPILQKEGLEIPEEFYELLVYLDDTAKKTLEAKVKLSPTNAKSLKSLQVKLRKINKTYEDKIKKIKEKQQAEAAEEQEEAEAEAEAEAEEEPAKPSKAKAAEKPAAKTGRSRFLKDETEESDEESESDDDDSSDDEKVGAKTGPSKWIKKKEEKPQPTPTKKAKPDRTTKGGRKTAKPEGAAAAAAPAPVTGTPELTKEDVDKKLREIIAARGKKGIDRQKQIDRLVDLAKQAKSPAQEIEIALEIISAQFDATPAVATHMPTALWKTAQQHLSRVLTIIEGTPVEKSNAQYTAIAAGPAHAAVVGFVERLDDELTKSYQNIDPHTQEYVERLQDESTFVELVERVFKYFSRVNKPALLARVAARRLEHLYFKREDPKIKNIGDTITKLTNIIYQHGDERLKTRAALYHIYNSALRDNFYTARDMMLVSHLQESISTTEIPTQILFNRTMVQLGLCAFRLGLITEAHACLADIYAGGRVKELLAQGLTSTRFAEKNPDQEKQEKRRQIPYHLHINLELLECVHHVSAMLLEVPNMAANAFDVKKKVISRPYRRLLDFFDRQVFTGPPENTRDFVVHAGKALSSGDWKRSADLLLSLPVWNLLPNPEQAKTMLRRKIQEEGLRTHLFSFSSYYDSFSLEELSTIFELPKNTVHSLISKMIINEELHASWDQPTGSIVMHKVEPTRLQALALQLSDKAAQVVEFNERLLDIRTGGYKFDGKLGDKRFGGRGGQGGRGGRFQQRQGGSDREGGDRREGGGRGGRGGYRGGSGGQRGDRGDRGDRERNDRGDRRDNKGGNRQQQRGGYSRT